MKRWIVVAAGISLVLLVPLVLAASWFGTPSHQLQAAVPPIHFEVGRTYLFGVQGDPLPGKVLEEPRGNWLKVEVKDGGKTHVIWLNLHQVAYIETDPELDEERPPCKECGPCCPTVH